VSVIEMKIGAVTVRLYFGFFAVVLFTFFAGQADSFGVIAALTCCVLHEMGHLTAMCLLSSPPEKICFYAGGIKIIPRTGGIDRRTVTAVILASGCAVNFLLAAVSYLLGLQRLFEVNIALGTFNLLPFSYFDGGRIISLFAAESVRKFCTAVCGLLFAAVIVKAGGVSPAVLAVLVFAAASEIFM
jgi:Zn-dependent protease